MEYEYPWVLSASIKEKFVEIEIPKTKCRFTAAEAKTFAEQMLLMAEDVRLGRERIREEIRAYVKKHEGYDPFPEIPAE